MKFFCIFENVISDIFYEESALSGVKRVANTVSEDLFLITGEKPNVTSILENCKSEQIIITATLENSALIPLLKKNY
jgi:hypothetical protein